MKKTINPSQSHLRLELPSAFEHLEHVVDATGDFLASHVDDEDFAYRVVLLVSEAVTNAIKHGNQLNERKRVAVDMEVTEQQILVFVTDEGKGFQRNAIEDPREDDNLLSDHGRGLFLMETMADEVFYEEEGRCVRMVFNRPP